MKVAERDVGPPSRRLGQPGVAVDEPADGRGVVEAGIEAGLAEVQAAAEVVHVAAAAGTGEDRAAARADIAAEVGDIVREGGAGGALGREPDRAAHLQLHRLAAGERELAKDLDGG